MTSRGLVGSAMLVAVSFSAAVLFQEPAEDRIADLETRVATLEAAVFSPSPVAGGQSPDVFAVGGAMLTDDGVEVAGTGTIVVGPFPLEAGTYAVSITANITEDNQFKIELYSEDGSIEETLTYQEFFDPQEFQDATVITVPASGDFYLAASRTNDSWQVILEAR